MGRLLLLITVILIPVIFLIVLLKHKACAMAERYRLPTGKFPLLTGLLMFVLPFPVLIAALVALARGKLLLLIGDVLGYSLFLTGALLLRRGLLVENNQQRCQAAQIRLPLKTIGIILISLATGVTAWLGAHYNLAISIAFSMAALLGCYMSYGFSSQTAARRFTDHEGIDITEQVIQALAQAERSISVIEDASCDICNTELNTRLKRIAKLARDILQLLEQDPRDLRRARKFLHVYLDGAEKVVEGYAKTHTKMDAPTLDDNFRRVLITIEEVFAEQHKKLLEKDMNDLDIQIEVLTTQLKQEGVV